MSRHSVNPWIVLVVICFAQFMVVLDATIVNVALKSISTALHFGSEASLQWVVTAYTLVFAGFLLLGGRVGDLLGRKRFFLIGLVIFTVASLLNGLSTSAGELVGFRALQGLGAALISPAALSIISTTFAEGKERARALGVWAAIAIGGSAFGLVLGGWLTQDFSWNWIFFINVPIGVATFLAALRFVPESKVEQEHRRYDLAGAVTVTGGLMALVYGLAHSEHGWGSTWTIVPFIAAALLLTAFVLVETRSLEPLVRLGIFRVRSLLTANLAMFLAFSGMFAMFFFNSLYIREALKYKPLETGLAFLPFTGGIMISAGLASGLAPRIGVRPIAAVGMVLTVIAMVLFARMPVHGVYATDVLPGLIVGSLGMGAIFMPLTLMATTGLKDSDQGLASGLFNTSQQVGGALGLAILSTIATSHTASKTVAAQVHGFHYAFAGAAVLVALSLLVMVALLRKHHVAQIQAEAGGVALAEA